MKISLATFGGMLPLLDSKKRPDHMANLAENVDLEAENLSPLKVVGDASDLPDYKALQLITDYDVAKSPIYDDQYDRFYFTTGGEDDRLKVRLKKPLEEGQEAPPKVEHPLHDILGGNFEDTSDGTIEVRDAYIPEPPIPTFEVDQVFSFKTATASVTANGIGKIFEIIPTVSGNSVIFKVPSCNIVTQGSSQAGGVTVNVAPAGGVAVSHTIGAGNVAEAVSEAEHTYYAPSGEKVATQKLISADGSFSTYTQTVLGVSQVFWTVQETVIAIEIESFVIDGNMHLLTSYVNDLGVEGPPCDLGKMLNVPFGCIPKITGLGVDIPDNIVKTRIYVSCGDTPETAGFRFIDEIPAEQESWGDRVALSIDAAEPLPNFGNAPKGLKGLVMSAGGFWAAFKGTAIYFGEPNLPYTCPAKYTLTANADVVGIAVAGNDLIVCTKEHPELITGSHPEVLTQTKLMLNQSCVSKKSITQVGSTIFYASPDGLVGVVGGQAQLLTEQMYKRKDWQALNPSTLRAECHDKKLFGFFDSKTIIVDFKSNILSESTETASKAYSDLETDTLYIRQDGLNKEFGPGADNLRMTWRSKDFHFNTPIDFYCYRIIADEYPPAPLEGEEDQRIFLRLYNLKDMIVEVPVYRDQIMLLPAHRSDKDISLEVSSVYPIDKIEIATSIDELQ